MLITADNLTRALYGRIANLSPEQIPQPYRLNKPFIEGITNSKIEVNTKQGIRSCMNWIISDPKVEFIGSKTGKTSDGELSRLCKRNLFKKFVDIFHLISNTKKFHIFSISYKKYKENCTKYQKLKKLFFDTLESNGCGKWIRKPKELDLFLLSDLADLFRYEVIDDEISSIPE